MVEPWDVVSNFHPSSRKFRIDLVPKFSPLFSVRANIPSLALKWGMSDTNHLDPAVLAVLPAGGKVLAVFRHGRTNWSTGYKVEYEVDNEEMEFFLKVLDRERADEMALGEFESSKALMQYIPEAIVPPIAWGRYREDPTKAFYLTHFRYLHEQLPTSSQLLPIVQKLHQSSSSPTGKFGFHVTTFWGPPPMDNTWTDSWEEYYTRKFRSALEYGQIPHGRDEEMCELGEQFIQKVIPRLLRPFQTGGRNIKPTLCHGDLYDANIQIDSATNQPVLFDPCCFYGHHEMDLQSMRAARNAVGPAFVNAYKNEAGASEPQEDFDDRNALYSIRGDLETVGMWPQWRPLLQTVKDEMRRLLAKHPDGIDGFKEGPVVKHMTQARSSAAQICGQPMHSSLDSAYASASPLLTVAQAETRS